MRPPAFTEQERAELLYELQRLRHTRQLELGRLAEALGLELNEALTMVLEDAGWHRWVTRALDQWRDVAAYNEILFLREAENHAEADRALKDVLRVHRLGGTLPEELIRRIEAHLGGSAPVSLEERSKK